MCFVVLPEIPPGKRNPVVHMQQKDGQITMDPPKDFGRGLVSFLRASTRPFITELCGCGCVFTWGLSQLNSVGVL